MAPRAASAGAKKATIAKTTSKANGVKKSTTPKPTTAKKAAATTKKATTAAKPLANGTGNNSNKKRKANDDEDVEPKNKKKAKSEKPAAAKPKKAARAPSVPATKQPKPVAIGKKINDPPTQVIDVYIFGEGTSGELGLGSKLVDGKKPIDVKRPRLNPNLSAEAVGVVQIACGGMHVVALTKDNKILTWGVNDQGALGRDTTWDGGLVDMDKPADDSDSEEDGEYDSGVNPRESTPTAVSDEHFAPGTKFVQVVASDSASFALTEDGRVYGWGTFRSSDGILGFTENIKVRTTPMLLPSLKGIKSLATGSNHILAMDHKGNVLAWGCGQQNQLGRRIIERNKLSSLSPQGIGLPRGKTVKIACGSYHSFAVDKDGRVWAWGLNNFGELGVESNAGEDDAVILRPTKLTSLEEHNITEIDGGEHHSLACDDKGVLYTWGRVDGYQVGFPFDKLSEENTIFDERGHARILFKPKAHETQGVCAVAAGTDNSFAITKDGKAYSWGFSSNYQTGQGALDDVETPTLIDNTAIRGKMITAAGAGGQYSILMGKHDQSRVNGANGA